MATEMKPILFYTIGFPGAGKTTLVSHLAGVLGGEHLRGDKIGLELFRFPTYSPAERKMVQDEMVRRAIDSLARGHHAFFDASNNTHAQRATILSLAKHQGTVAVGLWVRTPTALAKKRAGTARDSGIAGNVVRIIPPHVFDQYVVAFEPPAPAETIADLSGDASFYLQYRRLHRQLRTHGIFLPRLV